MTLLETVPTPAEEADPRDPLTRLVRLADPGSVEVLPTDEAENAAVVTARARVGGVPTYLFATDPRIQGGAMSVDGCAAIETAYHSAIRDGAPVVGVWHSGGARLTEGVLSLDGVGRVFTAMTHASGVVPQLSLVLGAAAGGAAYGPALTDVVVLAPEGRVFVTGPDVVRSVTGEDVDSARLGGAEPHGRRSGVAHVIASSEDDAYERIRALVPLLAPQGGALGELTPSPRGNPAEVLPESARRGYDVKPLLTRLLDGPGEELQARWAPNLVTTLARIGGRRIGVVANNPLRLGGCLDSPAAEKGARFVRLCDSLGIPLLVVVDVPGYLPGVKQEWDGVVRRGAKLLHAFADATVPRVTLVTRKAYGGAYIAMNSRSLGATAVYAWPGAEIGVMAALPAVRVLHHRQLAVLDGDDLVAAETRLADEYNRDNAGLDVAVRSGLVDAVVAPEDTRAALATAFATARGVRNSIRNIPL